MISLGLRLAAIAPLLAASGRPAQTAMFADIPSVTIRYYDVTGIDTPTIRAAMVKSRPTDPHDGQRVDALTRTELRWSWPIRDGICQLTAATVAFSAIVTLPRLADPAVVPDSVRAAWATYRVRLETHELTHVRYGYDGRLEVLAAIKRATCETANAAAEAALAAIRQRDIAWDRTTDHGAAEEGFQDDLSPAKARTQPGDGG